MTTQLQDTIGDIVTRDFRAAAVFQQFGIDFCCGGKRTIQTACRTAKVEPAKVLDSLEKLEAQGSSTDQVARLPLNRLTTHIVDTHHVYVRAVGPTIAAYLEKLVKVHGARHPELATIARTFGDVIREMG